MGLNKKEAAAVERNDDANKPKTTNTQPLLSGFGVADLAQSYKLGREERNIYPKISVDYFSPNGGLRPGQNVSQESLHQPIVVIANSSFMEKQKSNIMKANVGAT